MRRKIVAGNWKMHGSRAGTAALLESLLASASDSVCTCVVCPPFVYLHEAARFLEGSSILLGAQDVCAEAQGAYTGEIAASMLKDIGCRYVIVGHSERRAHYGDDDALVARKFAAAQSQSLIPILCVGEQLSERESGQTHAVVARQLDAVLDLCGVKAMANAVVAYEPVWAIGTGRTASTDQAQDVHAFIRTRVAGRDANIAAALPVLYGGSCKASNAGELFAMPDVDGGLIGGASLKAEEFAAIVQAAGQS